ncbi:MAG: DUF11 domain-containing protein, partial [Aggregatilineales bacterium]
MLSFRRFAFSALLTLLITSFTTISFAHPPQSTPRAPGSIQLPMTFEQNLGQADKSVTFLSRGRGYTLYLTGNQAVFALSQTVEIDDLSQTQTPLTMALVNSNPSASIHGEALQSGVSNYFMGNDPAEWQTNVPHYGAVRYSDVYSGIDLIYYGNDSELQYDFVVAPHSVPESIRINFAEAELLELDTNGDLLIHTSAGMVRQHAPFSYQEINGEQIEIASAFAINEDKTVSFTIGNYDPNFELTIDPVLTLEYGTYLGGSETDDIVAIASGENGEVYLAISTLSEDFPIRSAYQDIFGGTGQQFPTSDIAIVKINTTQSGDSSLIFSTYVGGDSYENVSDILVDDLGRVIVSGSTQSTNFPLTNAYDSTLGGNTDGVFFRLSASGDSLEFSTLFGGDGYENVNAISLHDGTLYIAGNTDSSNFPTLNAYQATKPSSVSDDDSIISVFDVSGTIPILEYSTYFGGQGQESISEIAVDNTGDIYVAGYTYSNSTPLLNAFDTVQSSGEGFLARLSLTPTTMVLEYSTYIGGSSRDEIFSMGLVNNAFVVVAGITTSTNLATLNSYQATFQGGVDEGFGSGGDGFVAVFDTTKAGVNSLLYSSYFGGSNNDAIGDLHLVSPSFVYVLGGTKSSDLPMLDAYQADYGGSPNSTDSGGDLFLSVFDFTQIGVNSLVYSTFIGGSSGDRAGDLALSNNETLYIAGSTTSTDLTTLNAFQESRESYDEYTFDSFLLRFDAPLPDFCPDGTSGNDAIVCEFSPPVGSNTDANVHGDAGEDTITINEGVTVNQLQGDLPLQSFDDPYVQTPNGSADILINNGTVVESIFGDTVYDADGADDTITNNGTIANPNATADTGMFSNGLLAGDFLLTSTADTTVLGGDDTITNNGTVRGAIMGDVGVVSLDVNAYGGADTIINHGTIEYPLNYDPQLVISPVYVGSIIGDSVLFNGADDIITNTGSVINNIIGEDAYDTAGNDTITNTGTVGGSILGEWMLAGWFDYPNPLHEAGEDIIINSGTVVGNVYGDYIEQANTQSDAQTGLRPSTGEGAADKITIDGDIGGSVFAEGGDDTVIVTLNATGGADNILDLYGGDGEDTIIFDYSGLDYATLLQLQDAFYQANPDFSYNGQTFNIYEFEIWIFGAEIVNDCDGTPNADIINCSSSFVDMDNSIHADLGDDTISVAASVTMNTILGDGRPWFGWGPYTEGDGGNDVITNDGTLDLIAGDYVTGQGGNDIITNNADLGNVGAIYGDFAVSGGDDTLINNGTLDVLVGDNDDGRPAQVGGNDEITNHGIAGTIIGDTVITGGTAGEDNITNDGTVTGSIYGDFVISAASPELYVITGEGAADSITNSGTVGGTIFAEGGDDTVILQDGANGGADNILPLDGGDGFDTLNFDFISLTQAEIDTISASNPANGSVTIGGEIFTFTNFERLEIEDAPITPTVELAVINLLLHPLPEGENSRVRVPYWVQNNCSTVATNVYVDFTIDSRLSLLETFIDRGTFDVGLGRWYVGTLQPEQGDWIYLDVRVAPGTSELNLPIDAVISSSDPVNVVQNEYLSYQNLVSVHGILLGVDINSTPWNFATTPLQEGDSIEFDIYVSGGYGNGIVYDVEAYIPIPDEITVDTINVGSGTYDPVTGIWAMDVFPPRPDENVHLEIIGTIAEGASGQTIELIGEIISASQPDVFGGFGGYNDNIRIPIDGFDASFGFEVTPTNPSLGEIYTINVQASADEMTATNVALAVNLPWRSSFLSATPSIGTYNPSTGIWFIPSLDSIGETLQLQLQAPFASAGYNGVYVEIISADQPVQSVLNSNFDIVYAVDALVRLEDNIGTPGVHSVVDANVGDIVDYVVTVTNDGPEVAMDVQVDFDMLFGIDLNSTIVSQGTYDQNFNVWSVGSLEDGETATITLNMTMVDVYLFSYSSERDVVARLVPSHQFYGDSYPYGNVSVGYRTPPPVVDLDLRQYIDNRNPNPGEEIRIGIVVKNMNDGAASNVVVTDLIPDGLEYVSHFHNSFSDDVYDPVTDTLTGEFVVITAQVPANAEGQSFIANMSVTSDQTDLDPINNSDIVTIAVGEPTCPDGTPDDDIIVCSVNPPVGSNTDGDISGDIGEDQITINAGVIFDNVTGDGVAGSSSPTEADGADDIIIIYGDLVISESTGYIYGDFVTGNAGNDTITNNGDNGFLMLGDYAIDDTHETVGGNDILVNNGTLLEGIAGDWSTIGGDDEIVNNVDGIVSTLIGDTVFAIEGVGAIGGDDSITNYGSVVRQSGFEGNGGIIGDDALIGGDDTIVNIGSAVYIMGDRVYLGGEAGEDTITNIGIIELDIYGDYVFSNVIINPDPLDLTYQEYAPTGDGASDTITNSGTVSGTIFAEGGNDTVILQDGANGGADNSLPLDGGADIDTLNFDFTSLTQTEIDAINNADPANGSVTIGGETFTFVNFEILQIEGVSVVSGDFCPDGTAGNDTIVCSVSPPVGSNTDGNVDGGAGEDNITINEGVTVAGILGEVDTDSDATVMNGSDDTIINNGQAGIIWGDGTPYGDDYDSGLTTSIGGDDVIHNTSTGFVETNIAGDILGAYSATNGNDTITNDGHVGGVIIGDGTSTYEVIGGNDIIYNSGNVDAFIAGDGVEAVAGELRAGDDSIINTGMVSESIYGDWFISAFEEAVVLAGEDIINNLGTVGENIYGDYVGYYNGEVEPYGNTPTGEGAVDIITNSGTVGGTIFAEGGDDTVILQDGANGSGDNILPLDGGIGIDTLRFEFTGLTIQQVGNILDADPANGSVTINGQTFTFVDFESIEVPNYVPGALTQLAPIGTITTAYGNPTYSWSDRNVASYELYVGRVDNTQVINPTVSRTGICNGATCSIDLTTLAEVNRLTNGAHQWYVREAGGVWIGPMNFTLNAPPPGLVTLGATTGLDNLKPTFNWTLSGNAINATYFNLYLQTSAGTLVFDHWFTRAEACEAVNGTTCSLMSPVELTNNASYTLYIRSYGSGGYSTGGTGGYAGSGAFTINATYPSPISP